jgi:hypothetical protein
VLIDVFRQRFAVEAIEPVPRPPLPTCATVVNARVHIPLKGAGANPLIHETELQMYTGQGACTGFEQDLVWEPRASEVLG